MDIQIYDLVQAFYSLWLQDCMNDIYDCLPENQRDRKLALIYETNINNFKGWLGDVYRQVIRGDWI